MVTTRTTAPSAVQRRPTYEYVGSCVGLAERDVMDMTEAAEPISRRRFLRQVDREELAELERDLGYDRSFPISRDWHVGYFASRYQGREAAYLTWSAIEHVFAEAEDVER